MQEIIIEPQINTLKDKANFVLHLAASSAAFVAISHNLPPAVIGAVLCSSAAYQYICAKKGEKELLEQLPETPIKDLPNESKVLPRRIMEMSKALKILVPPFHLARSNQATACIVGFDKHTVLATTSLLEALTPPQEAAVVAHELGHKCSGHSQQKMFLLTFAEAAHYAGLFNYFMTAGAEASAIGLFAYFAARHILTKKASSNPDGQSKNGNTEFFSRLAMDLSILGVSALQGRGDVFVAWGAAKAITTVSHLIIAHKSRCDEFQADRIAAQLTDPEDLISALQKIDPKAFRDESKSNRLSALFSTHPSSPERCRFLRTEQPIFAFA